jgi:hypothetical protein
VTCRLSCGFVGRGSRRLLVCIAPVLTVADPCIWHGCGTDFDPRQSATRAGGVDRPGARAPRCPIQRPEPTVCQYSLPGCTSDEQT